MKVKVFLYDSIAKDLGVSKELIGEEVKHSTATDSTYEIPFGEGVMFIPEWAVDYTETIDETPDKKDSYMVTKSLMQKYTMFRHRTHYIKCDTKLSTDVSFRYFFESQDNKYLEESWWMCDHKTKHKVQVTREFVLANVKYITSITEIIGRYLPKRGYHKVKIDLPINYVECIKE